MPGECLSFRSLALYILSTFRMSRHMPTSDSVSFLFFENRNAVTVNEDVDDDDAGDDPASKLSWLDSHVGIVALGESANDPATMDLLNSSTYDWLVTSKGCITPDRSGNTKIYECRTLQVNILKYTHLFLF